MSLEVLVEEYLVTMKEDGELDLFLPMLLSSMGHVVTSAPQKGVRQSGGDLVTVGKDEDDGVTKVFVWVIKCGDIDRTAWNSGEQAVRQTLDSVMDVFLSANLTPSKQRLPKKVCVVTNGRIKQDVQQDISGYLTSLERRYGVEADDVTGSALAKWTVKHMLDERILPDRQRSLMRRALANVESPDASYEHARPLVVALIQDARTATGGSKTRQRKVTGFLRAIAVFNAILFGWAKQANNLESAYRTAEFTLIAMWSFVQDDEWIKLPWIARLFANILSHYLAVVTAYHIKLDDYYRTQGAFGVALHESSFVVERVFEEIGRLGAASTMFSVIARSPGGEVMKSFGDDLVSKLRALLETHTVAAVPCYDRHAIDISCGMAALILSSNTDVAKMWLHHLVVRLVQALNSRMFAPVSTDSFDDVVALRYGQLEISEDLMHATTLLPSLAFWAYKLACRVEYEMLRERAQPLFKGATLNVWFADKSYESLLASPEKLEESGFGATVYLPESMTDLPTGVPKRTEEMLSLQDLKCAAHNLSPIVLLASRHWKLQLPHDIQFEIAVDE